MGSVHKGLMTKVVFEGSLQVPVTHRYPSRLGGRSLGGWRVMYYSSFSVRRTFLDKGEEVRQGETGRDVFSVKEGTR